MSHNNADLRLLVQKTIHNVVQSQDGYHTPLDILRILEEETHLQKETQELYDTIVTDPYNVFDDVQSELHLKLIRKPPKQIMKVTSCERIRTGSDFCSINAVVTFEEYQNLQLTFKYERKKQQRQQQYDDDNDSSSNSQCEEGENEKEKNEEKEDDKNIKEGTSSVGKDDEQTGDGCHIWYSIGLSREFGKRENIIEVQVWAAGNYPSSKKAVCVHEHFLMEDDENDDEDDSEDDDEQVIHGSKQTTPKNSHAKKKQKLGEEDCRDNHIEQNNKNDIKKQPNDDDDDDQENDNEKEGEPCDHYAAILNPDLLHSFLESTGLSFLDDITAFFLLMTFPYYEHEWDIIGYLLDQAFGGGGEDVEWEDE